jgi:hypothetical protein
MNDDELIRESELDEEEIILGCESGSLEFAGADDFTSELLYRRILIRAIPPDDLLYTDHDD